MTRDVAELLQSDADDRRLDALHADAFDQAVAALLTTGPVQVVLDGQSISYASSAGLRCLLSLAKRVRATGGRCRFAALSEPLSQLFEQAGFTKVLEIFPSVDAAVE